MDIGDILDRAADGGYRRIKTVQLFDQSLINRHSQLDNEYQVAVDEDSRHHDIGHQAKAPALADQIDALEAEIAASAITFKFGALSYRAWTDLLAKHPPTRQQIKAAQERATSWRDRIQPDHNPDTFPPALVAACAIEPEMTAEQAGQLADHLGPDQFELLYQAALEVNRGGTGNPPKSTAVGVIRRLNGTSGDTAAPAASSVPSS